MADFALPVQYLRLIADLLAGMRMDVPAWLRRHGLDEVWLAQADGALPYPAFHALLSDAHASTGEPALGLLVGERLRINTHGMLGYAALNSSTLRQALVLFERFVPVRTTLVTVRHAVVADTVQVQIEPARPLDGLEQLVIEAVMLTVKNLIDHITLGACAVRQVCFDGPAPAHAALASSMFRCEVRYGAGWHGLVLPLADIDRPLSTADPASFEEAARICQRELDRRDAEASMSNRVRRLLLDKPTGFPSLVVTARLFNMTPRTLHRRLQDEGTTFARLLDEVRHRLAVQHMKAGQLTLQDIAFHLGYTDPANFRRAFKRWEGVAPSAYQAAQTAERTGM
ncbi:AraC family transcriptional regulator [Aquabacterium olei]|uniref:AraC family transcriptional regulator n=1 Tax=Aquabacterium olei TaxID=1296669 RepID=A0A2U8FUS7_9BURK|nr:AraC family transcriptional regulator [Aquabacterium olei]AWI54770.1 AraC family transcriptional regulator [Aquabacterium olei]